MALGWQRSFSYGEISPALYGRVDTQLYQQGLRRAHNVIFDLFGGVRSRPALNFRPYRGIRITEGPILPFQFSTFDSALWQLSPEGVTELVAFVDARVYKNGTFSAVTHPEIASLSGRRVSYSQTADEVTVAHTSFRPFTLIRTQAEPGAAVTVERANSALLNTQIGFFGFPAAVDTFQQRFFMAGSGLNPQGFVASKVGTRDVFTAQEPLTDADFIAATLVSKNIDRIVQMAELGRPVLFTEGSEFAIGGQLTPFSINPTRISGWGCSDVPVVEAQNFLLWVPGDKKSIRAMERNQYDNLDSRDLTLFSAHIFKDREIFNMAHAGRFLVVVFTDGTAAVCTYDSETPHPAWSTMDTNVGDIRDVYALPVNGKHKFFFVVEIKFTNERFLAEWDPTNDKPPHADQIAFTDAQGRAEDDLLPGVTHRIGIYDEDGRLIEYRQNAQREDS